MTQDTRAGAKVEDLAEQAYWSFDARRKGYSVWRGAPQSERDAFKAEFRIALADERRRAFQSVLEELRERFLEDDELIQWVTAQAGQEGE